MSGILWSSLHTLSCLLSLYLGFCFSRLFYLSPSPSPSPSPSSSSSSSSSPSPQVNLTPLPPPSPPPPPPPLPPPALVRPTTGRHQIQIRPYPHPNPTETLRAHQILSQVQSSQRRLHISPHLPSPPRPFLIITPTCSRTFQTLHLSSLANSLLILPFPFTWILVEPRGSVNETTGLLARFPRMDMLRLRFDGEIPDMWAPRLKVEAQMRLLAIREIRERRMEGIIVFADESNIHTMEFFDEAQKVKRIGLASVGILVHAGPGLPKDEDIEEEIDTNKKKEKSGLGFPVMGPACNKSGHFIGFHSFDSSNYTGKIAEFVGEEGLVLPGRVEWAGFVVDSRILWGDLPDRVRAFNADEVESPLDLVEDTGFVEALGSCGKKVLAWWIRVETRPDSKYPTRWVIDEPLENVIPAKQTPWPKTFPEAEIETEIQENLNMVSQNVNEMKRSRKSNKSSRSRHRSRGKRKREGRVNANINTRVSLL